MVYIWAEINGGCVSNSSQSTCSSRSNGEGISPSCLWINMIRRKRSRRSVSNHITTLQHLSSIPNLIFTHGRCSSSCIFTQQGLKGINQDAIIVWEDFMAEDVTFFGVFDGHDSHGHLVARKVRDTLPLKLSSGMNFSDSKKNGSSTNWCYGNVKSDIVDPVKDTSIKERVESLWREAFLKAYKAMDKELRYHSNIDCFCSGSTAATVVKKDEPEVQRVWLPFDDAPGLAMARAFGDFCLKEYGVISIPEFSHWNHSDRDKFVVLASDGVWDVLSNEEVVGIVSSAPTRSSAARILVESAAREWKAKYLTSKMDDFAVVLLLCLFLDGKMDSESDYEDRVGVITARFCGFLH